MESTRLEVKSMPKFDKVNEEINNGRLWKARDRLLGLFSTYPTSQEVLELLGEVFYKMGDLPEAGRYWFLTELKDDPNVVESINAFKERSGYNSYIMLKQLPARLPYSRYGPTAFSRVTALAEECQEHKIDFIKSHSQIIEDLVEGKGESRLLTVLKSRGLEILVLSILLGHGS